MDTDAALLPDLHLQVTTELSGRAVRMATSPHPPKREGLHPQLEQRQRHRRPFTAEVGPGREEGPQPGPQRLVQLRSQPQEGDGEDHTTGRTRRQLTGSSLPAQRMDEKGTRRLPGALLSRAEFRKQPGGGIDGI